MPRYTLPGLSKRCFSQALTSASSDGTPGGACVNKPAGLFTARTGPSSSRSVHSVGVVIVVNAAFRRADRRGLVEWREPDGENRMNPTTTSVKRKRRGIGHG